MIEEPQFAAEVSHTAVFLWLTVLGVGALICLGVIVMEFLQ